MLFTTGQLRFAFKLSKQKWRGYLDALSPLAKDQGRSACFTAADLLATSVVHRVYEAFSISPSSLKGVAVPLFEICASVPWPQLERSTLLIDLQTNSVALLDEDRRVMAPIGIVVEMAPLVAGLRQDLLASGSTPQGDLAFPPILMGARQ